MKALGFCRSFIASGRKIFFLTLSNRQKLIFCPQSVDLGKFKYQRAMVSKEGYGLYQDPTMMFFNEISIAKRQHIGCTLPGKTYLQLSVVALFER